MDLNERKVSEFEDEKVELMDDFINKNKSKFNNENLKFSSKLKKFQVVTFEAGAKTKNFKSPF